MTKDPTGELPQSDIPQSSVVASHQNGGVASAMTLPHPDEPVIAGNVTGDIRLLSCASPLLRHRAIHVQRVNKETQQLFNTLMQVMTESNGIGIAAPQIGVMTRCCIVKTHPDKAAWFMANPELYHLSGQMVVSDEGCLSFPGETVKVDRHWSVGVSFLDFNGHRRRYIASGLAAICVQHEIDHLDGITFHMRARAALQNEIGAVAPSSARVATSLSVTDRERKYREALEEVDRWSLVIESAIRHDAPSDLASIYRMLELVRSALPTEQEGWLRTGSSCSGSGEAWLPIETYDPKTSPDIVLIEFENGHVTQAEYSERSTGGPDDYTIWECALWPDDRYEWPTKWRPLPAPSTGTPSDAAGSRPSPLYKQRDGEK